MVWCGLGGEEGWEGEEVTRSGRAIGDEGEYFGDESLLDGCFLRSVRYVLGDMRMKRRYQLSIELGQAGLTCIVEDQYGVDHDVLGGSKLCSLCSKWN